MRELSIVCWMLLTAGAYGQYLVEQPVESNPNTWASAIADGAIEELAGAPKIVMESIENCPACKSWARSDAIDLLEAGWTLQIKKVPATRGLTYPRWKVCLKDGCSVIENTREFKAALQRVLDARRK